MQKTRSLSRLPRRALGLGAFVLVPLAAAVLVACGGGGGAGSSSASSTAPGKTSQSVVTGTVTGFGSVYIDGMEYDDSAATVTDDLGNARSASALELGMQVQMAGQDGSGGQMGSATSIVYGSDIEGPVSAVDTTNDIVTVLGQQVDVNAMTVWDPSLAGGLAGLTAGEVLKIYSLYDSATGRYVASRVDPDTGATSYKLRGTVSNLDTTAKTYTVGATPIDYSGVASAPSALADGVVATAELQTTMGASAWTATGLQLRNAGTPGDHVTVHVRGLISAETSATAFTLDGWPIDASGATFPSGQGAIVAGASVQVDGIMTNGSVVASNVDIQQPGSHGGLDFQVHGPIDSIDTTAQTFSLRGQTVSYAGSVSYTGGTAASLAVGTKVLVQGTLSSDGSSVQAVSIAIGQ